jgi:hypothetical protein
MPTLLALLPEDSVQQHLTAVPALTHAGSGATEAVLERWLAVQRAVRDAADAASAGSARASLDRAISDMRSQGRHDGDALHETAQLTLLRDALRLLTPRMGPGSQVPPAATTELELCASPVRAGDVLCLLRISASGGRVEAAAGLRDLRTRVVRSVRSGDQVVAVDDVHLLVVMADVSVPVAWRRMTGLVGERPRVAGQPLLTVHASLARVGPAGPRTALESAKGVLSRLTGGTAGGWIALAEDSPRAAGDPAVQAP